MGIKQPSLSKIEKQGDMQLSALQRLIAALGGKLEILARLPNNRMVRIDWRRSVRPSLKEAVAGKPRARRVGGKNPPDTGLLPHRQAYPR